MTTRDALQRFFARLETAYSTVHGSLPFTYRDKRIDDSMYCGFFERGGDTWGYWVPRAKEDVFDFSESEAKARFSLHPSVKEFFNSFWFFALRGKHERLGSVTLFAVLPGLQPQEYEQVLAGYREWWGNRETHFAPIGDSANNDTIVVHGSTGEVHFMWDTETPNPEYLAPTLAEFIDSLEPFVWPKV